MQSAHCRKWHQQQQQLQHHTHFRPFSGANIQRCR